MDNEFLNKYFNSNCYLQNPPLNVKEFIKYCKNRGINVTESELEFYEKEQLLIPLFRLKRPIVEREFIKYSKNGKTRFKPLREGLKSDEKELGRYTEKKYSSYGFSKHESKFLNELLNNNFIYSPENKGFQNWVSLKGEYLDYDNKEIVTFYSTFQYIRLNKVKNYFSLKLPYYQYNMDFNDFDFYENDHAMIIKGKIEIETEFASKEQINLLRDEKKFDPEKMVEDFIKRINGEKRFEELKKERSRFKNFLVFLSLVQSGYYPYFCSGSGFILSQTSISIWRKYLKEVNPSEELKFAGLDVDDLLKWYSSLSKKSHEYLGVKRDDWIQLWKNIKWSKKDKLKGKIRLGIEYLQTALMLKRIIEDIIGHEILDVDEINSMIPRDIKKYKPDEMFQNAYSTRYYRNIRNYDENEGKNYYKDQYKKLYYLGNSFGYNYQPRLLLFVEGHTEELIIPKFWNWYFGNTFEDIGIDLINLKGISKLFGREIHIKKNNRYKTSFINNFKNLLSYNFNKWQIIPFFLGDDENNICSLLSEGISITIDSNNYPIPGDLIYLWGISNNNSPFKGKDFELANYSNKEIVNVLSNELNIDINAEKIINLRNEGLGISSINTDEIIRKKKINFLLMKKMFEKYEKTSDDSIINRPIFKALEKIRKKAIYNHPPKDRENELKNRENFIDLFSNDLD